jgi:hypothetical protein
MDRLKRSWYFLRTLIGTKSLGAAIQIYRVIRFMQRENIEVHIDFSEEGETQ